MPAFDPQATVVIRNPVSGRRFASQRRAAQCVRELRGRGFDVVDTRAPGDATSMVREAAGRGARSAIVIGGDGTVLEVMSALPASCPLAVFPTGTVNLLAHGLSLPSEPDAWLQLLDARSLRRIYLGRCNGKPFCDCASIGLDSWAVATVNPTLKRWMQEVAYGLRAFRLYFQFEAPNLQVTLDGAAVTEPLQGILVGKGPYFGGPHRLFPGASLEEPRFEVVLLTGTHRRIMWKYVWGLLSGRLPRMRGPVYRTCTSVAVETDPAFPLELDGDGAGLTPATFTIDPEPRTVLAASADG